MISVLNIALTLGVVALAAGSWLGWQLLRQNGRVLLRLDQLEKRLDELEFGRTDEPPGLPLDSLAPDFDLPNLAGEHKTLAQYRGETVLLIFFNPGCGFCRELVPKLVTLNSERAEAGRNPNNPASNGEPHSDQPSWPHLLIISTGDVEANRKLFSEHKVTGPVLLQKKMEVATAYKAKGTPTGYLINSEGRIASELAVGAETLLVLAKGHNPKGVEHKPGGDDLVPWAPAQEDDGRVSRFSNRSLARSKIKRDGLKAGTQAPDFRLPRLDGGELTLGDLRGRRVLLVFSSPHCGPCNTLAPKLQKFHQKHPDLEIVMVSQGEPGENRAKTKHHGLTFPVVLQKRWEVSRDYAFFGTPVAYLIDTAGVIAADIAVGMDAIMELMQAAQTMVSAKEDLES